MKPNKLKKGQKYELSSKNIKFQTDDSLILPITTQAKNIWEDDEGELASKPIDENINNQSNLLQSLQIVMQIKGKVRPVTDLAFYAVDANNSGDLDH